MRRAEGAVSLRPLLNAAGLLWSLAYCYWNRSRVYSKPPPPPLVWRMEVLTMMRVTVLALQLRSWQTPLSLPMLWPLRHQLLRQPPQAAVDAAPSPQQPPTPRQRWHTCRRPAAPCRPAAGALARHAMCAPMHHCWCSCSFLP